MTSESKPDDSAPAGSPLWQPPAGLPEPARQVWLAGLGALARAQAEGGKAFEALVRQGVALQTQASEAARERIAEAAHAATQPWERLSGIFEDRVARALTHLGQPSAEDWAALQARVQALEVALQDVLRGAPKAKTLRPSVAKKLAKSAATGKPTAQKSPVRATTTRAASGKKARTLPSP
jgi:poly(hydroxyalkanoate) granule-associated protein